LVRDEPMSSPANTCSDMFPLSLLRNRWLIVHGADGTYSV
jgi:hypothetical protein